MAKVRSPGPAHQPRIDQHVPVAAVDRALSVLGAFRIHDGAVSLAELAGRTGLNKATILRLAATLQQHGYLSRTATGDYRVGPAPLALATIFQRATQPAELILPSLERLAEQTGESAAFFVTLNSEERVCLYRVDSHHAVREHLRPGDVAPMKRGAAGRVLTAFAAGNARPDDLVTVTASEVTPDVRTAAAPVFDAARRIAGAVCVSGPQYRFTVDASARANAPLRAAARDITRRMGGDASIFDDASRGVSA